MGDDWKEFLEIEASHLKNRSQYLLVRDVLQFHKLYFMEDLRACLEAEEQRSENGYVPWFFMEILEGIQDVYDDIIAVLEERELYETCILYLDKKKELLAEAENMLHRYERQKKNGHERPAR